MEASLTLLLTSLSAGSLFLAAFLLILGLPTSNNLANRWLGAFFFLLSLVFVQFLLELTAKPEPILIRIAEFPRWLIFPFIHFSVYAFVHPNRMPKFIYLHLLPAVLFMFFSILHHVGLLTNIEVHIKIAWLVKYFFFIQGIFYAILNIKILQQHKIKMRQLLADRGSDLNWLRHFIVAPFVVAIIWLFIKHWNLGQVLSQLICLLFCLYFTAAALRQRAVYPSELETSDIINKLDTISTNDNQRLTNEQITILKDKVTKIIAKDKIHLDPLLNLKLMADKVGINTHELSLILNRGFGKNFYAYINELRTEEAIKLLKSGQYAHGDMSEIAIKSGFNSRTTFYSSIKKIKGTSPASILKID
ncbi:MAG: helix-turn-helix domain-containing protein [Pedobacter sp.]|uniref:helix-turn-helix domain-containing protein n=1 Tax=Pedobacter sp. TaxID=1411316 RepID=UPI0028094BD5|nr:helix-turn-helix domain-containing protein [Pedobacter sp.]MDQ8006197.1 helix-turn-helix domain-containing protein [Pedobacter sp.]